MESNNEFIVAAAIKYRPIGFRAGFMVRVGKSHAEIIRYFADIGLKRSDREPDTEEQGFWTTANRFVTRIEAYQIARTQNQLIESPKEGNAQLISENVNYRGILTEHSFYLQD